MSSNARTVQSNAIGILMLTDLCERKGVHMTNIATDCVYSFEYMPDRSQITSQRFAEKDPTKFGGSFYSFIKPRVEAIMHATYPSILTLRIRMPISDDLHSRAFVTKLSKYDRMINIPDSNSILCDLVPLAIAMSEHKETRVSNVTNPGTISHNEVLSLYKEIVHPIYQWKNFTLEQ